MKSYITPEMETISMQATAAIITFSIGDYEEDETEIINGGQA